jgi:hypothetical protein
VRPRALCRSGPVRGVYAPYAFPAVNRLCMVRLYGRAGCLIAQHGGFRPYE